MMNNLNLDKIELSETGELYFCGVEPKQWLRVKTLFPESHPAKFISLINDKNEEIALFESLTDAPVQFERCLQSKICEQQEGFEVLEVLDVLELSELRIFETRTQYGLRKLITKSDDWHEMKSNQRMTMLDIFGDRYQISCLHNLNAASLKILVPFIDHL